MSVTGPTPTTPNYGLDDILKLTNPSTSPTAGIQTGVGGFRRVLGSVVGGIGNVLMPGIGSVIGNAIGGSALGGVMPTLGSETTQYLALQQQIQRETLAFTTASTIMKERHTMAMDAVRNMKS